MCNQSIDDYVDTLKCVPECFKTYKACNKLVNTYPSAIQFVPEWFKT